MTKKLPEFTGYSPKVKKFLSGLSKNNNKDWFDQNRKFYETSVRDVSKSLITAAGERFAVLGMPYIADPRRSMFRINRDIRFSRNKDPYKTNIGVFFPYGISQSGKKPVAALGLYFHFEPSSTFIAGGIHTPPSDVLGLIREKLDTEWKELEKIVNRKIFKKEFPRYLEDESLKRVPRGYPKDHPGEKYLRMKMFTVLGEISHQDCYSDGLIDLIIHKGKILAPFLEFFNEAIDQ